MPQGLQIYDENGNEIFNTTTRVSQVLGTLIIPRDSVSNSGTLPFSGNSNDKLFYTTLNNTKSGSGLSFNSFDVSVWLDVDVIRYSYSRINYNPDIDVIVIYGIY